MTAAARAGQRVLVLIVLVVALAVIVVVTEPRLALGFAAARLLAKVAAEAVAVFTGMAFGQQATKDLVSVARRPVMMLIMRIRGRHYIVLVVLAEREVRQSIMFVGGGLSLIIIFGMRNADLKMKRIILGMILIFFGGLVLGGGGLWLWKNEGNVRRFFNQGDSLERRLLRKETPLPSPDHEEAELPKDPLENFILKEATPGSSFEDLLKEATRQGILKETLEPWMMEKIKENSPPQFIWRDLLESLQKAEATQSGR